MTETEEIERAALEVVAQERLAAWARLAAALGASTFAVGTWPGGITYNELAATVVALTVALTISLCSDWVARGVRSWQ